MSVYIAHTHKPTVGTFIFLALRIYLGIIFLLACLHKIAHPEAFALDVASYQFLPVWAINAFALVLPFVELFAGIFLILGFRTRAASLLIAGMMLAFIIALIWALQLGLDMSCGCFASSTLEGGEPLWVVGLENEALRFLSLVGLALILQYETISMATLLRDGIWLLIALLILGFDRKPLGLDRFIAWK